MDFVRGLTTVCGAGSAGKKDGFAIHVYTASISMDNSCLANADGDMLIVPQQGEAQIACRLTFAMSIQHSLTSLLVHTTGVHHPHLPQFGTTLNTMCVVLIIVALLKLQSWTATQMPLMHLISQIPVVQITHF